MTIKSKIIFLNGCTSAGKSTLAKAIQELSEEKFLYVGIDALFGALPRKIVGSDQKVEEGFRYVIDPKTGNLIEMKVSPYAGSVFSFLPKIIKLLADDGLCDFGGMQLFTNAKKILELTKQNVTMPKTYYITHEEITVKEVDYWLDRYAKYDDKYWSNRKYDSEINKERHKKWCEDTVERLKKRREEITALK